MERPLVKGLNLKNKAVERAKDLSQSRNWYLDRYERIVVQRNALFLAMILLMLGLGISVYYVAELNRRKVFEPFVIEVEDKSGIVTQVTNKNYETYTADEMVIRYFINQYIEAREGYHPSTAKYNQQTVVRLLSNASVYGNYWNGLRDVSRGSLGALGDGNMREVNIKSITFLDNTKKRAQVRIVTRDVPISSRSGSGVDRSEKHYIITMDYEFVKLELSYQERYTNPLGFQVTNYIKEEESIK